MQILQTDDFFSFYNHIFLFLSWIIVKRKTKIISHFYNCLFSLQFCKPESLSVAANVSGFHFYNKSERFHFKRFFWNLRHFCFSSLVTLISFKPHSLVISFAYTPLSQLLSPSLYHFFSFYPVIFESSLVPPIRKK